MNWSPALAAYLGATSILEGWVEKKLRTRLEAGKEDPDRFEERLGSPGVARPEGPLAWFHAASVGESLSILELLRSIRRDYPDINILVTTGTRTSAQLLSMRLPAGVIHQYVPVDTKSAVDGFMTHWHPDLAVWTESELWPRLMTEAARQGAEMVLVNGRMSAASAKRWRWLGGLAGKLLRNFDLVLVQDEAMAERFRSVGAARDRIVVTGSLKEGAVPLPHDEEERKALQAAVGRRPVWLGASTHAGEEAIVAEAHALVQKSEPDLLLILAPRHPERGEGLSQMLNAQGFSVARRSVGERIGPDTDVYLADTLGEMGLWYRIAPVSFVGGSLSKDIGGHNPFEPAALGSAILHGPDVSNFRDIYDRLAQNKASLTVTDAESLADGLRTCLEPDRAAELAAHAWEVSSEGSGVTTEVLSLLEPFLNRVAR